MALFNCPECGKEMSDQAKSCPNCGYRVKKSSAGKIIAIVLVLVVVVAAVLVGLFKFRTIDPDGEPTAAVSSQGIGETNAEADANKKGAARTEAYSAGDSYTIGTFEQGDGPADIEWIVLDKTDDKLLLVSKYALDCRPYNDAEEEVTWETCDLRSWLNGEFLNTAFSPAEQSKISETSLENKGNSNPEYCRNGGSDTLDKVFILSEEEFDKYFDAGDSGNGISCRCKATPYAAENGARIDEDWTDDGETLWWLRTPGYDNTCAMSVIYTGKKEDGGPVSNWFAGEEEGGPAGYCVRPAMWVEP